MRLTINDLDTPDALVVPFAQGQNLADDLAVFAARAGCDAAALQQDFKADAKEVFVLYTVPGNGPTRRFYLLGLGAKNGLADVQAAFRSFCHRNKSRLPQKLAVELRHIGPEKIATATEGAAAGMLLGLFQVNKNKPAPEKPAPAFGDEGSALNLLVPPENEPAARVAARRAEVFAHAQMQIFDLVNAPGNKKTPAIMADFAKKAGAESGFSVRILGHEDLIREGLDALLTVNQGSPNAPVLILLDYSPKNWPEDAPPAVGLVGKGVTFDTGGISIKPSGNMHYMKSDMGGAAAVLGAFMAAARLGLPIRLTGAIPATENMVDGAAAKPGDVCGSYSGKTIEITDTDAEGRVILADAIAYLLKNRQPDTLVDLATLTGSIIRAIGTQAGGLFTKNDALAAALAAAGERVGERLWRMPMWDEYGSDLKSDVADLRNYTGKPMAESITAAKFLEHFTAGHKAWAHLDIAGMAFGDSEFAQGKSATGYGIRLLVEFLENWKTDG